MEENEPLYWTIVIMERGMVRGASAMVLVVTIFAVAGKARK